MSAGGQNRRDGNRSHRNKFDHSAGGMERQAYDIVSGLLDRGLPVTVVAKKARWDMPVNARLSRLIVSGFRWLPQKFGDTFFSWKVDRLRKRLGLDLVVACNRVEHADVAVCGGSHAGFMAAMGKKTKFYHKLHLAIERKLYTGARLVLTCSRFVRDELISFYGADPACVHTLYPAVDTERFVPCDRETKEGLRRRFGFSGDRKTFLFPSYSHVRKGLPFLRPFFEKTDLPVELAVVGRDCEPGRNIVSLGSSNQMERLYQAADATVMASVYEPFGLVGVESVMCGTPVILTENMGCCEIIAPPALHAIKPGDYAGLERAVREVCASGAAGGGDLRKAITHDIGRKAYIESFVSLLEGQGLHLGAAGPEAGRP